MLVHRTSVCSFATEFALNLAARPSRPSLFKVNRPRPAPRLASSSRPVRKLSDAPFTSSEFKASSAAQGSIVVAPFATLFYDTVKMLDPLEKSWRFFLFLIRRKIRKHETSLRFFPVVMEILFSLLQKFHMSLNR